MILSVIVKPKSKQNKVTKLSLKDYKIYTVKPAINNQANLSVINLLSKYLSIPKSSIKIVKGFKTNHKKVKIIYCLNHF